MSIPAPTAGPDGDRLGAPALLTGEEKTERNLMGADGYQKGRDQERGSVQ